MRNGENDVSQLVKVSYKNTQLIGDVLPPGSTPNWIVLHGAGTANRDRYRRFREGLSKKGTASTALDFVGHGDTGGELLGLSLADRVEQATLFIKQFCDTNNLTVVGASMGAYVATKLTEVFDIKKLVLIAPAAYTLKAYQTPFGPEFTDLLSKEKSYLESDMFSILKEFKGSVRVLIPENDQVIPKEITNEICESATDIKKLVVSNSPHALMGYVNDDKNLMNKVVDFVLS